MESLKELPKIQSTDELSEKPAGTKDVTISLPLPAYDKLKAEAADNIRSPEGQALALILQALELMPVKAATTTDTPAGTRKRGR